MIDALLPFSVVSAKGLSLVDLLDLVVTRLGTDGLRLLFALPRAFRDAFDGLARLALADWTSVTQVLVLSIAILGSHVALRRALANKRRQAAEHPVPLFGLIRQSGYEILALLAAAIIARVLVVRWIQTPSGLSSFPVDWAVGLVRWLFATMVARFLFQPEAPKLRLVSISHVGAGVGIRWAGALLALGHLHSVFIQAGARAQVSSASLEALSVLVALCMVAGAFHAFGKLRKLGLGSLSHAVARGVLVFLGLLWIGGTVSGEHNLFRGAVGSISIMILAWILDRAIAISIDASRRPVEMRRLFVLRVFVGALAIALIIRVLIDFWVSAYPALLGVEAVQRLSSRVTWASALVVVGCWISALIYVWTEARISPLEGEVLSPEAQSLRARLSTILPIIRFGAIAIIMLIVSLMALAIIGVDITPLIAGAGILGLAISLGSQTLVKDIVSGLFYMFDDVFRIGEMIESNGRRGRLESISTRSVRLRDEDGRVHTIPFGDLGTVTNHSRQLMTGEIRVHFSAPCTPAMTQSLVPLASIAIRSDKWLQGEIVGTIAHRWVESSLASAPAQLELSFVLGADLATEALDRAARLLSHELVDAGFKPSDFSIATRFQASAADKSATLGDGPP